MAKKVRNNTLLDMMMMVLRIRLPQMIGYVKYFDKNNKRMSFGADDNELLKKYIKIWKKN